jgi:hypothetical protein
MERIPIEDIQRAAQTLLDAGQSARGPVAASIAHRRAARVARLTAAAARLEEDLGSDADEVTRLKERVARTDTTRVVLDRRAERERRRPEPAPHEWMVYGRVLNADRTPAEGARVRLFDKDRKYDDFLGDTKVDEFGDFAIGPYRERDFLEAGEETPELYLKIYGARNRLVFDGSDHARFGAGRIEYMEIVLPPPD